MNTIIGLAVFGIIIMVALFLGQMLIYILFAIFGLILTAIVGAVNAIVNLFKGE